MHDVFDCLAEERDHYFSSDPHLIDLTLATGTTVDSLLAADCLAALDEVDSRLPDAASLGTGPTASLGTGPAASLGTGPTASLGTGPAASLGTGPADTASGPSDRDALPTPHNVLVDHDVAATIAAADPARVKGLREALATGILGWAGGGPPIDACLDLMSFNQAESVLERSRHTVTEAVGSEPAVYARFAGTTPSDMTSVLVRLGYVGLIPLDFAGGTGFGDEAKVILRGAGAEIESLTAKPIDATSDASFLTLGPRLGESIDGGEIATALLAHWPQQGCDSHHDLRRVASWCLALGRFWKLDDYFREGERPYHHGNGRAASPDAPEHLVRQVETGQADPLTTAATTFREQIAEESAAKLRGLTSLVAPATQTAAPSPSKPPRSIKPPRSTTPPRRLPRPSDIPAAMRSGRCWWSIRTPSDAACRSKWRGTWPNRPTTSIAFPPRGIVRWPPSMSRRAGLPSCTAWRGSHLEHRC